MGHQLYTCGVAAGYFRTKKAFGFISGDRYMHVFLSFLITYSLSFVIYAWIQ